ncbi:MAG: hypothetical protein HKN07_03130 [Acidimicrobiia bacterium]|nr:hypothetical protein [Acidimicrobiia bacterium]
MSETTSKTETNVDATPAPVEATTPPAWYVTLGSWYTAPVTSTASQRSK